jgi:hypothetical protein
MLYVRGVGNYELGQRMVAGVAQAQAASAQDGFTAVQ